MTIPREPRRSRAKIAQFEHLYGLHVHDAIVVMRLEDGSFTLERDGQPEASGSVLSFGFLGLIIGLVVLEPLAGAAIGAALGGLAATSAKQLGVDDNFLNDVKKLMKPGTSALFLLTRTDNPDAVERHISGLGGTVLQTNVNPDLAKRVQESLNAPLNPVNRKWNPVQHVAEPRPWGRPCWMVASTSACSRAPRPAWNCCSSTARTTPSRPAWSLSIRSRNRTLPLLAHVRARSEAGADLCATACRGRTSPPAGCGSIPTKVLLDPYGRGVVSARRTTRRDAARGTGDNAATAMKSVVVDSAAYDWEGDAPAAPAVGAHDHLRDARPRVHPPPELRGQGADSAAPTPG